MQSQSLASHRPSTSPRPSGERRRTFPRLSRRQPPRRAAAVLQTLAGLALGISLAATAALAQGGSRNWEAEPPIAPARVQALTEVRVVVGPGQIVEQGTVVLREGRIEAAGAEVEIPPEAEVLPRPGLTIYAGLIESFWPQPWPEAEGDGGEGPGRRGGRRGGETATTKAPAAIYPNAKVRAHRDYSTVPVDDETLETWRAAGFTTALLAPEDGVLGGASALINLGEGGAGANLLRPHAAQHAAPAEPEGFGGGYPNSLMGSVALLRQAVADARWYADSRATSAAGAPGPRPAFDRTLEALGTTVQGERPVIFHATDLLATLRAARLLDELELDGFIVGSGEEYRRAAAVAASGRPLVLPLSFPEAPELPEEGDNPAISLDTLRHWDQAPSNPARLLDAGATVALTAAGLETPKELFPRAVRAREAGLEADDLLAAFTTIPARLLGLEAVAGTVEAGKMANLVVVEGDLFPTEGAPQIREVWVDGRQYEVKEDSGGGPPGRGRRGAPPRGVER